MREENNTGKKVMSLGILLTLMISLAVVGLMSGGSGSGEETDLSIEELSSMSYDLPNGELVRCLNNNNITLYISKDCGYCEEQKDVFGDSFWGLNYVDCSLEGANCSFLTGVPSWVSANNSIYPGVHNLGELKDLFKCTT